MPIDFPTGSGSLNLESINAELIRQSIPQSERLLALNNTAIHQMRSLLGNPADLKIK